MIMAGQSERGWSLSAFHEIPSFLRLRNTGYNSAGEEAAFVNRVVITFGHYDDFSRSSVFGPSCWNLTSSNIQFLCFGRYSFIYLL